MTMTTDTPRPATSRMAAANAARQRAAAAKDAAAVMRRLRWLDDAALVKLGAAVEFEQCIRAQGATTDDDAGGGT